MAAVVTVTSIRGLVPKRSTPLYGATKAALRSFTHTLRHQLEGGPVRVVEVVPPLVDTAMTSGCGRGKMSTEHRLGKAKLFFAANRFAPTLLARLVRRV